MFIRHIVYIGVDNPVGSGRFIKPRSPETLARLSYPSNCERVGFRGPNNRKVTCEKGTHSYFVSKASPVLPLTYFINLFPQQSNFPRALSALFWIKYDSPDARNVVFTFGPRTFLFPT